MAGESRRRSSRQDMPRGLRLRTLLVAALAWGVVLLLFTPGPFTNYVTRIDIAGTSIRYHLRDVRGHEPPNPGELKVVGFNQHFIGTLAKYGDLYPFARDIHAVALRRLGDAGAKLIVVDILFSEEGSWEEAEDAALRDAILYCKSLGCEVVLACAIDQTSVPGVGVPVESLVEPADIIMEAKPLLGTSNTSQKLTYRLTEDIGLRIELAGNPYFYTQPVAAFRATKAGQRFSTPEELERWLGGKYYRINYFGDMESSGTLQTYDDLFPEAFDDAIWLRLKQLREGRNAGTLTETELEELYTWGTTTDPSHAEVLRSKFEGATVFVGSRNRADNDYFNTPFGEMFGVDTLAQAYDTLARGRVIRELRPFPLLPWTIPLSGLLALLGWTTALLRPIRWSVIAGVTVFCGCLAANVLLFTIARIEISLTLATAGFALPYLACIIYGGAAEEGQRKRIHDTFSPYLSDELVNVIIADPSIADLGGKYFRGAVMFNDIRSYSTITENLDARQIVEMLNLYLGEMASVIRDNHGFVDKFMGDGLLAFFGGPVARPDSAADAVRASLAMVRVLHEKVHPRLWDMGLPPLKIGIGLHYGDVVMGTIGSVQRKNYTVVGDAVNVAARVEAQTKEYGWAILATQELVDAAGPGFDFEFAGHQQVKGRSRPVELYRLVDPQTPAMYHLDGAGLATIPAAETSVKSVEG